MFVMRKSPTIGALSGSNESTCKVRREEPVADGDVDGGGMVHLAGAEVDTPRADVDDGHGGTLVTEAKLFSRIMCCHDLGADGCEREGIATQRFQLDERPWQAPHGACCVRGGRRSLLTRGSPLTGRSPLSEEIIQGLQIYLADAVSPRPVVKDEVKALLLIPTTAAVVTLAALASFFLAPSPDRSYSLRPKINVILGFKFCPTKNATLTKLTMGL
jgi:hypothetical protein